MIFVVFSEVACTAQQAEEFWSIPPATNTTSLTFNAVLISHISHVFKSICTSCAPALVSSEGVREVKVLSGDPSNSSDHAHACIHTGDPSNSSDYAHTSIHTHSICLRTSTVKGVTGNGG